jgi:iron complex outermembrane receptor protein
MNRSLQDEIRGILAVAVAAAIFAPVAAAQQSAAEADKTEAQKRETVAQAELMGLEAKQATEFQEVVVTGSRIKRTEFTSPAPVTVITSERSQLAGLLTTEEILRNSTVASGQQVNDSFSGFVTDGGAGANTISLRGLGAQRTLVLVNGKRWSPSGVQGRTNSVDLSAIPSSIINRIEILKDGASSIYGADAVAGVVNVITKESHDGFQLNGQGQTTHDGGGERYILDGSYGKVGDRGSFSISAQYAEQKRLVAADRSWSRCDTFQRWTDQAFPTPPDGVPMGDGNIDNRDPATGKPLCFGFIYGLASTALGFLRYEPTLTDASDAGNPFYDPRVDFYGGLVESPIPFYTRMPVNGLSASSWPLLVSNPAATRPVRPYYDNEGAYYRDELSPKVAEIQTPSKLVSVTSFGQLDMDFGAGQSTAYYEAYYNSRKTDANGGYYQYFPVVLPLTDESYQGTGPLAFNPYNPFAALELLGGLGSGLGIAQPVLPVYNLVDPTSYVDVERYNVFAGLKGDLAGDWDYDVVAGYGHSKGTYRQQVFLDGQTYAATNQIVVRPDGSVTCDDAALAAFPTCVPANLFTEDALLRGILPADVLAFITKNTKGDTVYEGLSLSAFATGPLFNVPSGAVKAVFGAEYRDESIDDVPDIEAQNNNYWGFTSAGITKGDDQVRELFSEIEVPILEDRRFAEDLYFSGSYRWTDYESYGSDTTYRVALNYQVTPQFLLRSTYGTSFRAPDLYEQFLADNTGFVSNLNDPCINYGQTRQPGDPVYDNCAAQGLAPDYTATSSILAITGGASDLNAETSDALTIGLVFTPSFADVSFAIDYFDIKIADTVESPSVGFILNQCYNSAGFSSPFCTRVGPRDPNNGNQLDFVDSSFVNVGKQQSRGYDFNFLLEHQFPAGKLTVDATATYLDKQNYEVFGEFTRLEGRWGFPRLSANSQIRYDWRDWRFGWFVEFIGASKEQPNFDPDTTNQDRQNRTPNTLYHTASVRYTQSNWEAIATLRNVFDKSPPYAGDQPGVEVNQFYNTLPGVGYDLFGRTYVLQLSYQF